MVVLARREVGALLALSVGLAACDTYRDVIAVDPRVDQGFFRQDASLVGAPDASEYRGSSAVDASDIIDADSRDAGYPCSAQSKQLYFLDQQGELYAGYTADSVRRLTRTNCWDWARAKRTQVPLAIDLDNRFWIAPYVEGTVGLFLDDGACQSAAPLTVAALTTVIDPQRLDERLYMLGGGTLYDVSMDSLQRTPLGPLDASFIVGTASGQLWAVQERDPAFLSVGSVSLSNAQLTPLVTVANPGVGPLRGAAPWGDDLLLLLGTQLYKLTLASRTFSWFASVQLPFPSYADASVGGSVDASTPDGGIAEIVAMMAPACASQK